MIKKITETRPCRFTDACGYNTRVETTDGDGIYDGYKVVTLVLGETDGFSFREHSWSTMTPTQARDLAEELIAAANEASNENAERRAEAKK